MASVMRCDHLRKFVSVMRSRSLLPTVVPSMESGSAAAKTHQGSSAAWLASAACSEAAYTSTPK
jgi:hypothetical protein